MTSSYASTSDGAEGDPFEFQVSSSTSVSPVRVLGNATNGSMQSMGSGILSDWAMVFSMYYRWAEKCVENSVSSESCN